MGNHICKDDITPARLNYLIYVNIRNPELCKQQLIFVCGIFESKLVLEFTLCRGLRKKPNLAKESQTKTLKQIKVMDVVGMA